MFVNYMYYVGIIYLKIEYLCLMCVCNIELYELRIEPNDNGHNLQNIYMF